MSVGLSAGGPTFPAMRVAAELLRGLLPDHLTFVDGAALQAYRAWQYFQHINSTPELYSGDLAAQAAQLAEKARARAIAARSRHDSPPVVGLSKLEELKAVYLAAADIADHDARLYYDMLSFCKFDERILKAARAYSDYVAAEAAWRNAQRAE